MIKRVALISVPIIIIAGIIILIISKNTKNKNIDIYNYIPVDASVIIEIKSFNNLINKTKNTAFYGELIKSEPFEQIKNKLNFIDSLIKINKKFSELINKNNLTISFHTLAKDKLFEIIYLNLDNTFDNSSFIQFINQLSPKHQVSKRIYENKKIFQYKDSLKNFYFSIIENILILSSSDILIEKVIREFSINKSVFKEKNFYKIKASASAFAEANIYLNYRTIPSAILSVLNKDYNHLKINPPLADWAAFDLSIKKDAVLLNGITISDNNAANYYSLFYNQSPASLETEKIIPSDISAFYIFRINNYDTFIKQCKQFLTKSGKDRNYSVEINTIERKYNFNIENFTKDIFDNEAALIFFEDPDLNIAVVKTKSQSITHDYLKQILSSETNFKNVPIQKLQQKINIDDEVSVIVYNLPITNLPSLMFANIFWKTPFSYFSFYNNYLIFSNSIKSIKQFHKDNLLRKTIINEPAYKSFTQYLSSKANFYFYFNTPKGQKFLSDNLNPSLIKQINKNFDIFKKFETLAFQFSSEENIFYNNICLRYLPFISERPKTVWESKLDTTIISKPTLLTNFKTGQREIFVYDINNNIYLLSNSGRILWKLQLPEPIISNIYQVDYYKNNKLQILFNTKNFIFLIDRNGNYVDRFPVKLRSPATNGISLFDYENNKDYRIFVATASKKIYVYDIKGNLINGWNFETSDQIVTKEIQFFRIDNKDYIIFSDQIKSYFLDRKGNERLKPKKYFLASKNNKFILDQSNSVSRFVTTDTAGNIVSVYPDGDIEITAIKNFSSNHFFDFQDIDKDGRKDYIFLDNNNLEIFSQNLKKLFNFEFNTKLKYGLYIYDFGQSEMKIGLISEEMKEIYLIDSNGQLYKGFPLKGITPFSIGFLKKKGEKFNLIVGSDDNFLYNYLVE
jgi:hypothetical protein